MKSCAPLSLALAMIVLIVLSIAIAGCSEGVVSYDILVTKFDAGGHTAWSTKIGSGNQNLATAVTDTRMPVMPLPAWLPTARGPQRIRGWSGWIRTAGCCGTGHWICQMYTRSR